MRRVRLLSLLLVLCSAPAAAAVEPAEMLYVVEAKAGWTTYKQGEVWLTLDGVRRRTLAFADRPARLSTDIPTRRFARMWRTLFAGDPPNAGIVVARPPAHGAPTAVELTRPRWNADGTLTFCLCRIESAQHQGWLRAMKRSTAQRHGQIALFVDDATGGEIYNAPGSYAWTVPPGVSSVFLEGWGAGADGTAGGTISGLFAVEPGQVITLTVGSRGAAGVAGAPDGGGAAVSTSPGQATCIGGGGGGSTRFTIGGSTVGVAAGGGGFSLQAYALYVTDEWGNRTGGYSCEPTGSASGGNGGGARIGGSPPGSGQAGGADGGELPGCFSPECDASQPTQWLLDGGGGGGGGSAATLSLGVNGVAGDPPYYHQSTGGTNWLSSSAELPIFGTSQTTAADGMAAIIPLG